MFNTEQDSTETSADVDIQGMYFTQLRKYPLLSQSEELRLGMLVKKGNKAAREQMINSNLRLVVNIALKYSKLGTPLLDLVQDGNVGLMHAVNKYEPSKGYRFSTYATWWIKHYIRRGLDNTQSSVRVPVHIRQDLIAYVHIVHAMTSELCRVPTDNEIAEKMGKSLDALRKLRTLKDGNYISLDVLPDKTSYAPSAFACDETEAIAIQDSDAHELYNLLSQLPEKHQHIIARRFGFGVHDEQTLDSVGEQVGLTRERVRQIQEQVLAKLRDFYGAPAKIKKKKLDKNTKSATKRTKKKDI